MKGMLCLTLLLACLTVQSPSYGADRPPSEGSMQAFLETNDVIHFVEAIPHEKWSAPVIYSKWHVDNLIAESNKGKATMARELGRLLAQRVGEFTHTNRATSSSTQLLQESQVLLDLADWLNQSEGYGNYLLGMHCLDLAAVAMGRCVVDETLPLKSVQKIALRLHPAWTKGSVRQRILNTEAGTILFHSPESDETKIQEHIKSVWIVGEEAGRKRAAADPNVERLLNEEPLRTVREHPEINANAKFFERDRPPGGGLTTVEKWDGKRHIELTWQLPKSISIIDKMIAFRNKLGGFPKKDGVAYTDNDEGARAFWLAWKPYGQDDESRQTLVGVWDAYHAIQQGEFVDDDTKRSVGVAHDTRWSH